MQLVAGNALRLVEFLGKMLGMALRSGELLSLDLPGIVWKAMVDQPITEEDVMDIDRLSFKMLHELRKLESHIRAGGTATGHAAITPAEFAEYMDSTFVVVGSDMLQHALVPGGESIPVTWSNRAEFVQALLWYRKHEFRTQCQAIRNGMAQVLPISLLSMLTWQELRNQICGSAKIDVGLLKKSVHTQQSCVASRNALFLSDVCVLTFVPVLLPVYCSD